MNTFWLELLPALVAAAASLLGIVVGIGQLTSAARLRRRATFWSEQLSAAELAHDRAVAQSLHRETTANLIALQAYPSKTLLWQAQFILIGLYGVGATGYLAGTLAPNNITFQNLRDQGTEPVLLLVLVTTLNLGLANVASILERRRRVARWYLDGRDLAREQQGDEDANSNHSFLDSLGLLAFSTGICLLIAVVSFAAGIPKGETSSLALASGWYLGGVMAGVPLTLLGLRTVLKRFSRSSNDWLHPRVLSPEAKRLHTAEPQSHVETGVEEKGSESKVSKWLTSLTSFRSIRRSTNEVERPSDMQRSLQRP